MLITLLATIVVLGVLIFVHELGHFVTAKLVDIEVPRFSIGLGPKLWGFRRGETEYQISWLPLGGYVKMAGMEEMEAIEGGRSEPEPRTGANRSADQAIDSGASERTEPGARDFDSKSLPARALVISAGVLMNVLFAVLVFTGSTLVWGVEVPPAARLPDLRPNDLPAGAAALAQVPAGTRVISVDGSEIGDFGDLQTALLTAHAGPLTLSFEGAAPVIIDVPANDTAKASLALALGPNYPPVIGQIIDDLPAAAAGLRPGDRILAIDGEHVDDWRELVTTIRAHPGEPLDVTATRGGEEFSVQVTPEQQAVDTGDGETEVIGRIGAAPQIEYTRPGVVGALKYGVTRTGEVVGFIVGFLADLVTGHASPRSLGGPILIGKLSGEVARAGIRSFLNFMALFSVNLAVLNLLPIPVLDGGHLMFLGIEAVRGRALTIEQRMRFTQVGFVIVLAIMVWAIANDVLRLFGL